jgi:hypothetical protein
MRWRVVIGVALALPGGLIIMAGLVLAAPGLLLCWSGLQRLLKHHHISQLGLLWPTSRETQQHDYLYN